MPPLKTNRLTGLCDSRALKRFALSLPKGPSDCPLFGHLHHMRRVYLAMAQQLHKKEVARWRYENWNYEYGSGNRRYRYEF